jgi:hypothetical protein
VDSYAKIENLKLANNYTLTHENNYKTRKESLNRVLILTFGVSKAGELEKAIRRL